MSCVVAHGVEILFLWNIQQSMGDMMNITLVTYTVAFPKIFPGTQLGWLFSMNHVMVNCAEETHLTKPQWTPW